MKNIIVVNNYVELPSPDAVCHQLNDNNIIFLGKMNYEPNIVAVQYFAKHIFPKLKARFSNLTFTIVGANPTNVVKKLTNIPGIEVTGFVTSVEPYWVNSTIVVAPMLTGAGVQNKIIQAMSYGCCVATTSIGAEGLELNGDELSIFNSESAWIEGITELLLNTIHRKRMGISARKSIEAKLAKEII